jgi:hypothetical protein
MPKDEDSPHVTDSQKVYEGPTNVAQGESVTISNTELNNVIATIQAAIEGSVSNPEEKTALLDTIQSLQRAKDRPSFLERTTLFLGLAANSTQVALHINTWALVLGNLAEHF